MRATPILMAFLAAAVLPACSAEQAYNTGQNWQRNECNRIPDREERDRCVSRTGGTYDSYKQQSESGR